MCEELKSKGLKSTHWQTEIEEEIKFYNFLLRYNAIQANHYAG